MKKGFTLVQMLIVLAIIGILAGFFSFKYQSSVDRIRLNATSKIIAADVRAVQARAVELHEAQDIEFFTRHYIMDGKKKDLPNPIIIVTPRTFKFSPSGLPYPGHSGTVILRSRENEKKIVVSPAGRTRIE